MSISLRRGGVAASSFFVCMPGDTRWFPVPAALAQRYRNAGARVVSAAQLPPQADQASPVTGEEPTAGADGTGGGDGISAALTPATLQAA